LLKTCFVVFNSPGQQQYYESCKEHITYLQVDELHTSDEGVSNVNPRVRNLVTTRVMLMYYAFSMTFIDV
jgi:hypothetical protein